MEPEVCAAGTSSGCPHCSSAAHRPSYSRKRDYLPPAAALIIFLTALAFSEGLKARGLLYHAAFIIPYLLAGHGVLRTAFRDILRGRLFDENFLMTIATFGAIALGEPAEAAAVMLFYTTGELLQERAERSVRRSIRSLTDLRPDRALLLPEGGKGEAVETDPAAVPAGSRILVRPGERVPLDGTVVSGESFADTSALTGESVPVRLGPGGRALAGSVNGGSPLTIRTEGGYGDTSLARIIRLVEEAAERKAPTERFISRFAKVYTPAVVAAALLIAFLPPLFIPGALFSEWIRRALILLVVSCPCALVISIPLGYFGGIGGASRAGILIKGANYLESLAELHTVAFDKTGTLTEGVFEVNAVLSHGTLTEADILRAAAAAEAHSPHPIAEAVRRAAAALPGLSPPAQEPGETRFEELPGRGVRALIGDKEYLAGNSRLLRDHGVAPADGDAEGVLVAVNGVHEGTIVVSDRVKTSAAGLMKRLRRLGVRRTVMLTGDTAEKAAAAAAELEPDSWMAGLLPEQKLERLETLMSDVPAGGKTAFVGDGINDAPVLGRADVGIAMGGLGSDTAIEAADVVIMDDDPAHVGTAIRGARRTRKIVLQNITLALGIKGLVMLLGAFGLATMWMAIFADVGVALLAILNSTRALSVFR